LKLRLSASAIAAAASGELVAGEADREIDGFSIDSRTLTAGDLFLAIRGERFDGHAFVRAAIDKGASGVVGSDRGALADLPVGVVAIAVADTVGALQSLARHVRRESGARVVAITGSAGKTTTKEATAAFLGRRYTVFRNRGNLNNQIGLPLSLLELRHGPDVAVVELGMNHAGEIGTLVGIAEPEVRVWTNVGPAHLEFFPSVDAIADAKAEIFEGARGDDILVANADDPLVMARVGRFAGRVVTFGQAASADVRASDVQDRGLDGIAATLHASPRSAATAPRAQPGRVPLRSPLLGVANLSNVLAAAAVALQFDVPLSEIAAGAAALRPVPGRGEVRRLPGGVTLIDDSYNSNPTALEAALRTLGESGRGRRRVAVIGEMLELGEASAALHARCGRVAAGVVGGLVTVGGDSARALGRAAVAAGLPDSAVTHAATSAEAADLAARMVLRGDVVLVKGSRGVRTDIVVQRLAAEFA